MRKYIKTLAVLLVFCVLGLSASASTKEYRWFFKPAGNEQPQLLGGDTLWRDYDALAMGSSEEKVLYLTFDAGYENGNVAKVLDVLQKHDAKGAFFILPGIIKISPHVVTRMAEEGHLVCNHSTSHKNMATINSLEEFRKELQGVEDAYTALTGKTMAKFFRPPEGTFSENTLKFCEELGYTPVFWSYAYADWDNNSQMNEEKALEKLLSNLHPGEVLLLHPTSATNAAILDTFLTKAKEQGYRFGTLEELALRPTFEVKDLEEQGLVFSENPDAGKYLALTFDDGPHKDQTARILAVLQKHGVKATFFPIGENVKAHPELVKMAALQGHEIGNHTYSHCKVSAVSGELLEKEILSTEFLLQDLCGVTPRVFRPPGGDITGEAVELVNSLGYRYVLWSWRVDTRDWASVSVDSVVNTVLSGVKNGDIILFHDYVAGKSPTAEALEILIPKLQAQGYQFVTVSDLASL